MRLPSASTQPVPTDPAELAAELQKMAVRKIDGFVRADAEDGDLFLFLRGGEAYAAGAIENDDFAQRTITHFFQRLSTATSAELTPCEAARLLCIVVPFRKAPSAQLVPTAMTADQLRLHIATHARNAVLLIRRDDALSFVLCREGEATTLFAAEGEVFPAGTSIPYRIVEYAQENPLALLDVYDDMHLTPAPGSGLPFISYLGTRKSDGKALSILGRHPSLLVRLGGRNVFRYVLEEGHATIGRGNDTDLQLDNLSVSRHHARVRVIANLLAFEDLESENGLVVGGLRVPRAQLAPGQSVMVGKYELVHVQPGSDDEQTAAARPEVSAANAVQKTVATSGKGVVVATLEHEGESHRIRGIAFTIGKADDANLRIGGMLVAPVHVRIIRDPAGVHTATHVAGVSAMRVNGKAEKNAVLKDGDVLTIGGNTVTFRQPVVPPWDEGGKSTRIGGS